LWRQELWITFLPPGISLSYEPFDELLIFF
jgi:hypothetical protein